MRTQAKVFILIIMMIIGLTVQAQDNERRQPPTPEQMEAFRKAMQKYGILVAGGQSHLKGKIFRVAHMNIIAEREILLVLAMTSLVLRELGFKCESGTGVAAAQEILLKNLR